MDADPRDAEIARLRSELEQAGKLINGAQLLRNLVAKTEQDCVRRRRSDGFKLPSGVYETVEDIGRIDGAMAMLKTMWHQDDAHYRKASMHLSRLAWDLRKRLHEFL